MDKPITFLFQKRSDLQAFCGLLNNPNMEISYGTLTLCCICDENETQLAIQQYHAKIIDDKGS